MRVFAARASAILYDLLLSRADDRPFLLPANVCPIVPITFLEAGRGFRLLDVEEDTLALDAGACLDLLRREGGKYGGVLFVRPYGSEQDAEPFFRAVKELQPDLLLIDDKCLCRPDCDGAALSPWADATLWSTGPVKHVDLGYGGFAHLRDGVAYRRHQGVYREGALDEVTRRYKQAIAERAPFAGTCEGWLDLREPNASWEEHRERTLAELLLADRHKSRLNALYAGELPPEIQMPPAFQSWRFNLRVPRADRLVASLFAAGLFASRHYAALGGIFGEGRFPVAERVHGEVVNLFNDRHFDEARARQAIEVVRRHLAAETGEGPASAEPSPGEAASY